MEQRSSQNLLSPQKSTKHIFPHSQVVTHNTRGGRGLMLPSREAPASRSLLYCKSRTPSRQRSCMPGRAVLLAALLALFAPVFAVRIFDPT